LCQKCIIIKILVHVFIQTKLLHKCIGSILNLLFIIPIDKMVELTSQSPFWP
jgi:hypothetical protein